MLHVWVYDLFLSVDYLSAFAVTEAHFMVPLVYRCTQTMVDDLAKNNITIYVIAITMYNLNQDLFILTLKCPVD